MSDVNRNSGAHFLNLPAYNRFRRLISRRSHSSISDAESIPSSRAEEQGHRYGHGHLTLSAYNRFRSVVSRRSDSSISDAESIQSSQAKEQVFSTRDQRGKVLGFFLKPQTFIDVAAVEDSEVHFGQLKRFSLRELQVATDSFSSKNILGGGGFGKVYKGRLTDGSLVAVKRLKEERTRGGEIQFQTEVKLISMAVHRNLLRLRGFCMTPTERLLVYPYMANGSVASWLRERSPSEPPLDWPTRRQVALSSARGLSYLNDHCDPKIIHHDVKAANILLDEEFEAVVGDFGLAKLMKDAEVRTAVRGTIGHIAPEYLATGMFSEKTDVFGYGIMLLELITGQRAFDPARRAYGEDVMLLDWVKCLPKNKWVKMLVDLDLLNNYVEPEVELLVQVALLCTQGSPMERPKMSEVVRMLEGGGLPERWEERLKLEVRREVDMAPLPYWILDSTDDLSSLELSGSW